MPELPEVETVARGLRAPLVGRTIESVWYDWAKVIRTPSTDEFTVRIVGQRVLAVNRRAKYVLIELEHNLLAIHLKMTGRLYVSPPLTPSKEGEQTVDKWVHLRLGLDNGGALNFSDARRFGRAYLINDMVEIAPNLGPEPLTDDFTVDVLHQRLAGRHRQIKALLLDQSFIAGVGNIYADESLHRAGIHPLRPADSLSDEEITRLHETIRYTLNLGIEHAGATIGWYRTADGERGESQDYFVAYGKDGQPCETCGHPIVKIRVAQRGTHYCPNCQPEHKR